MLSSSDSMILSYLVSIWFYFPDLNRFSSSIFPHLSGSSYVIQKAENPFVVTRYSHFCLKKRAWFAHLFPNDFPFSFLEADGKICLGQSFCSKAKRLISEKDATQHLQLTLLLSEPRWEGMSRFTRGSEARDDSVKPASQPSGSDCATSRALVVGQIRYPLPFCWSVHVRSIYNGEVKYSICWKTAYFVWLDYFFPSLHLLKY